MRLVYMKDAGEMRKRDLLKTKWGRALVAFTFYFAEGAPIGFIWWAMPTLLKKEGVSIDVIAIFTSSLTIPWAFKFVWAPLIDVFRNQRNGFKQWIAWSQLFMCLTLLPLVFVPLSGNILLWAACLFLHSLCAATQDVSVDALMINALVPEEKGRINAYMQAGMLSGRGLFGGGALMSLHYFGLSVMVLLMILLILSVLLLVFFIQNPGQQTSEQKAPGGFKKNLKETFSNSQTWYALGFALTAAAAFEAVGAMAGPFLTDQHIDITMIGVFFAAPVIFVTIIGGLVGGFLADKLARRKALVIFLLASVFTIILISLPDVLNFSVSDITWLLLFSAMYFFVGMFTTSSYALFMDVTNPKLSATEFSTFMAATNACEAWVVWSAGAIIVANGYGMAFLLMCIISLLSLVFLFRLKEKKFQTD
ncbi:MAG: MFS transporter [Bacteroidia bacterium]|nr:MFS transporter [Bacteroidia bacterium]